MSKDEITLMSLKNYLPEQIPANDMSLEVDFLEMKLTHHKGYIKLSQSKYSEALVRNIWISESCGPSLPCDPAVDLSTDNEEEHEPTLNTGV